MFLASINSSVSYPHKKLRLRFAFIIFIVITFVLLIFQPFGTYDFRDSNKYGKLLGYGLINFVIFALLPDILAKNIVYKNEWEKPWTIKRELLILFITAVTGNIVSAVYFYFVISSGAGLIAPLWQFQIWGFLILFFPFTGYLYFLHTSNKQLITQRLNEPEELITITGNGKGDIITLVRMEVLFFKASDNYVEIYIVKASTLQKHLLRASLLGIYDQIKSTGFIQVHRSYIVNVFNKPEIVQQSGNYELSFKNCETKVPVSRTYLKSLRQKLAEIPL